ncbi:hypothetical protein [uncultured Methylobacterium sp.]|uniref:hypothetical protein n=1 Tax=uncultured Methylobacterium sp. TaxID=157278 RepID=UPI0035CC48F8
MPMIFGGLDLSVKPNRHDDAPFYRTPRSYERTCISQNLPRVEGTVCRIKDARHLATCDNKLISTDAFALDLAVGAFRSSWSL